MVHVNYSSKQEQSLAVIRKFLAEHGYAPTSRELAELLGVTQTAAQNRIWSLHRAGAIKTTPRVARSIVLL